ncbi:terminase small subunit [Xenorhabdus siamensis]|uniref:terminase small subunit n=1 Tax=Xenorhabdus siamensis TaxID=3136254 RepID=UPI0030F431D6
MAKPDWGALQNQFLAEHAKTGVTPKEWCEAQGLKYATARRYIRKPAAQNGVRKTAQAEKTSNIAQNTHTQAAQEEAQENDSVLKQQHEQFAHNIVQGMPQKEAAICAGYSPNRADAQAAVLMRRPDVRRRIRDLRQEAALLVSFTAKDLADLSFKSAKAALGAKKFGQVAPNIKNAAQLTGIDMSSNKTEVNVDLAGLSYGKVCIVTPANCPPDAWAAYMDKLRTGKVTTQQ